MARFYSCFGGKNDCDVMASGSPVTTDPSEAAEECSGKKKSKFQTFKNLFVKKKRKGSPSPSGESVLKGSQSSDQVNTSEPTSTHHNNDSDRGSKVSMGSKAMSHDSVFVSDSPSSETKEGLGTSQDSIHGKVKSLQLQLKQAIRLGSPPSLLCGRKGEDAGGLSDDDGLPCSPLESSSLQTALTTPHMSAGLTPRGCSLSVEASDSEDDQMSCEASSRPDTPQVPVPVDFSLPSSSVSCLDSSAARHRIAVKANARTKRKPASRQKVESTRDLKETPLLGDTEDELRTTTSTKEDYEDKEHHVSDLESLNSKSASLAFELEDDTMSDTTLHLEMPPNSPAEDSSGGQELVPASPQEIPVELQLPADDFLLDTGCEVVSVEQGSLLEEVLSSLKSPLVSKLTVEHENMVLLGEVEDLDGEKETSRNKEDGLADLLEFSEVPVTTKEEEFIDSLSESTVDSEEATEEEELMELPYTNRSHDTPHQVPGDTVENKDDLCAKEEEKSTKVTEDQFEEADMFEVLDLSASDEVVKYNAVEEDPTTKCDEEDDLNLTVEDFGNKENHKEKPLDVSPVRLLEPENKENPEDEVSVENFTSSDPTVRPEASNFVSRDEMEVLCLHPPEDQSSTSCVEDPSVPLKKEEEPEHSQLQEESPENPETISEQEEVTQAPSDVEVQTIFTVSSSWQTSRTSGGDKEQLQIPSLLIPETNLCPTKSEQLTPPKPVRTQSSPTLPVQKEMLHDETPENPFGVRLRKTPVLHRYGLDAESKESLEVQETPEKRPHENKPLLRKKPETAETVTTTRKIPDPVMKISVSDSESPSWISVARQKQRSFIENSPEVSPEKPPSQDDVKEQIYLPSLSKSIAKDPLTNQCSPLQVFCSLELSSSSMVEKDKKRTANPSTQPSAQDEPPWLALAKKKAKAWSEMPQIVQ